MSAVRRRVGQDMKLKRSHAIDLIGRSPAGTGTVRLEYDGGVQSIWG